MEEKTTMQALASSEVNTSLMAYMTTLGVDDWLFVLNLEVALLMVMLLKVRGWFFVAIVLHFVLVLVTRMAPHLLESYIKHLRQGRRYWPHASPLQKRNLRPQGLGRGEP